MAVIAVFVAITATITGVLLDEFMIGSKQAGSNIINSGLAPFGIVLAGCIGFYAFMKKKFEATNNEAIQALFILLNIAFVVLTIIGIWFRGEGMALVWPWE